VVAGYLQQFVTDVAGMKGATVHCSVGDTGQKSHGSATVDGVASVLVLRVTCVGVVTVVAVCFRGRFSRCRNHRPTEPGHQNNISHFFYAENLGM
jgi:hypothetical protein